MKNKNILFIIHMWIDIFDLKNTNLGGTTLYTMDLINRLRKNNNCFVFTEHNGTYKLFCYTKHNVRIYDFNLKVKDHYFSSYDEEYNNILEKILTILNIDLVHINHLIGHNYDCVKSIKKFNIKTIVTIHDYFMICPEVNLLYNGKYLCDDRSCFNCNKCMNNNSIDFIKRKEIILELLQYSSTIIVPDESVANEFKKVYPNVKYKLIEHGINIKRGTKKYNISDILNVAFVGVLDYKKGRDIVKEVIKNTNNNKIKFHLFGYPYDEYLSNNKENYIYHGQYRRKEIVKLLNTNNIDVVCILSICPESYCYTLSEVLNANIPVICFNLGAVASRVRKNDCGWILETIDSKSVIELLNKLVNNREEIQFKKKNVINTKIVTTRKMVDNTINEYIKIVNSKKRNNTKNFHNEIMSKFNNVTYINLFRFNTSLFIKNTKIYKLFAKFFCK